MKLPKLFTKARFAVANILMPNLVQQIRNQFNEAFLWGGSFTSYDNKAKTYIDKGFNINPFVYSIINQQSKKTASIPHSVKKVDDKASMNKLHQLDLVTKGDLSIQQFVKRAILETKAFSGDLPFPMERPNVLQTWAEWKALYKVFMATTGDAYMFMLAPLDGPNKGTPIQVYWLPSHLTQIVLKPKPDMLGVESPVKGYMLVQGRGFIEFEAENVIHIKYPNPNYDENGSHLYGQSPLRAALRNIQDSNFALDLNIKTLKSGGAFGLIHGNKTPLTPEQGAEIKNRLLEMDASPERMSKISGVSADVAFTRLSLTSAELKPFDYLKFDKQQIADVLNWSIDDENRGDFGGTIQEIKKSRITDNIKPDLDLLSEALNRDFLPRFKGYENAIIEFDFMQLPEMQVNVKELMSYLLLALKEGVVTRNEVRIAINYIKSDDKNMDIFTVSTDIMSLEEALETDFGVTE